MWVSGYSRETSAQHVSDGCVGDSDHLDRSTFWLNPEKKGVQLCVISSVASQAVNTLEAQTLLNSAACVKCLIRFSESF